MAKTQQQTSTQTSTPNPAAQPGLNWAMGEATRLGQAGQLAQPNTMSTVVPYAQQTTQGMNAIQSNANAAMQPGGYSSQMGDILANGGFNDAQRTAMEGIRNTATGAFDVNANPAFQSVLRQSQDAARDSVNGIAGGMGRTSGGAHQELMGSTVGDLTSRMVGGEYNNWQNRQGAAQRDLFSMGQTGQNNMPTAYANQNAPANDLMQIGGMNEDLYGRQLNDSLRIRNEQQNQPTANLQALIAMLGGNGQYGTQTNTSQMPNNGFSNAAGIGLGALSLL